jgi:pre-mRNA-splicing helicase BRR2
VSVCLCLLVRFVVLASGLSAGGLRVSEIDAYWLQRSLSKFYPDANQSQRMSEEVLTILQVTDERECENGLVQSLGFDKFDFVKLLLRNRYDVLCPVHA